ncbi:MAG TPA: energy-coupling factor transporter transmembrane component T [Bacteroidota bacterium]|nr:energy-coupling factor transporter transmembrane component T [Bacteroidota bacterium]
MPSGERFSAGLIEPHPLAAAVALMCTVATISVAAFDARMLLFAGATLGAAAVLKLHFRLLKRLLLVLPMSAGIGVSVLILRGIDASALAEAAVLTGRMLLIAAVSLLFGLAVPLRTLVPVLQALHVPAVLASVLWLSERYVLLFGGEALRMRDAVRARSVALTVPLRLFVARSMTSTLLLRAVRRGDRLGDAMLLRGFDGTIPCTPAPRWRAQDTIILVAAVVLCAGVLSW